MPKITAMLFLSLWISRPLYGLAVPVALVVMDTNNSHYDQTQENKKQKKKEMKLICEKNCAKRREDAHHRLAD